MEYKKINASFKERLMFLFTDLLPKKYVTEIYESISVHQGYKEPKFDINTKEEIKEDSPDVKMDIPFFDLDKSETKSNL